MPRELNIKIHFLLCALLAFFMPLLPLAIPILIILLAVNRLLYFKSNEVSRTQREYVTLYCFVGLYAAYLVGMLYSANLEWGLRDLETKLSLLVLPLIFFFGWRTDQARFKQVLQAFVWGCVVSAVYSYISSYFDYVEGKAGEAAGIPGMWNFGINHWLSSRLTKHFHPSYLSMYVNLAIIAVFYINDWPRKQVPARHYAVVAFLVVFVFFINAKSGLIFLVLLIMLYLYLLVFRMKKIKQAVMAAVGFIMVGTVLWIAAPEFAHKIKAAVSALTGQGINVKTDDSSAARRITWSASSEVIRENFPQGVGTGDVKDALMEKYREIEFEMGVREKLNSHNQFLQTAVAIGIHGLLLLCVCLLYPAIVAFRQRDYFLVLLAALLITNLTTESMLETQAGVVFVAFFVPLFAFREREQ